MSNVRVPTDERGISEIYGTLLIISLVFLTAVALVGVGIVLIDDTTDQSDDRLAQDSMFELDDRISELTGSSVEGETVWEPIEGSEDQYDADSEAGTVNITVETNETYWKATDPDGVLVDANDRINHSSVTLGTITHESEDGVVTAYQAGGLIESDGDATTILRDPDIQITESGLRLNFVDISSVNAITAGDELVASQNVDSLDTSAIQETVDAGMFGDGRLVAPVQITMTIESEFADGWAEYAKGTDGLSVVDQSETEVTIDFGEFGEGIEPVDREYDSNVIYTGLTRFATELYDEAYDLDELGSGPGFQVREEDSFDVDTDDYAVGIRYQHEDGEKNWWVWDEGEDHWSNIEDPDAGTLAAGEPAGVRDVDDGSHEFEIEEEVWSCVVEDSTDDFREYVGDGDTGCLTNAVDIENPEDGVAQFEPRLEITNLEITRNPAVTSDYELLESDSHELDVTVTLENTGTAATTGGGDPWETGPAPLAVAADEVGGDIGIVDGDATVSIGIDEKKDRTFTLTPGQLLGIQNSKTVEIVTATPHDNEPGDNQWDILAAPSSGLDIEVDPDRSVITEGDDLDMEVTVENVGDDGTQSPRVIVQTDLGEPLRQVEPGDGNLEDIPEGGSKSIDVTWETEPNNVVTGDRDIVADIVGDNRTKKTVTINELTGGVTNFTIDSLDAPETATTEELTQITATVTNTGEEGTELVSLRDGDSLIDPVETHLNDGETSDVTFDWVPAPSDGSETKDLTVETPDDENSTEIDVEFSDSDTEFEVSSVDAPETAEVGETVDIVATIENVGEDGEQQVLLKQSDRLLEPATVDIDNGSTQTVLFEWTPAVDDIGGNTLTVDTPDDAGSDNVEVVFEDSDPEFLVESVQAPGTVTVGETVEITATVRNKGDAGEQQVLFTQSGQLLEPRTVQIDGDDESVETFEWTPEASDIGESTLTLSTENDEGSATVDVESDEADTEFEVGDVDGPEAASVGETVNITATIQNEGDAGEQQVLFTQGDRLLEPRTVFVDGGSQRTETFEWTPDAAAVGENTLTVAVPDENESTDVVVEFEDGSEFLVQSADAPEEVTVDDELTVTADIENTGERDTQNVWLEEGGRVLVSENVTVDEQETVELDWTPEPSDAGERTLEVNTRSDDENVTVDIQSEQSEAVFDVSITSAPERVDAGEDLIVEATVENTGSESDTQDVYLADFGGIPQDFTEVSLGVGESEDIELIWSTSEGDADTSGDIAVKSIQDSETRSVEIAGDSFSSELTFDTISTDSPASSPITEGDELTATVVIRNDGGAFGSTTVVLEDTNGDPVDVVEDVGVKAGGSEEVTLTWQTIPGDATVGGESDTGQITARMDGDISAEVKIEEQVELRSPVDVMFVLDETGSMGQYEETSSIDDPSGEYTVPEEEVWVTQEEDVCFFGCSYDDLRYHIPGDTVDGDDPAVDRISVREEEEYTCLPFRGCYVNSNYDIWGDRIAATQTGISGLNESLGDRAGILEFDTDQTVYTAEANGVSEPLSGDLGAVSDALRIDPGGSTDITDAALEAESQLNANDRTDAEKVIVLLTDGVHNTGPDPEDVLPEGESDSLDEDITLYTVGFGGADDEQLREIAEDSGTQDGEFFPAEDSGELEDIFADVIGDVTEPDTPSFDVDIQDEDLTVTEGETATVPVELTNNGEADGEQVVAMTDFYGNVVDSARENLAVGETTTVEFEWETELEGESPPVTDELTVSSPDDEDSVSLTVEEAQEPEYEVSIFSTSDPIEGGETLEVTAIIKNVGDASGEPTVWLRDLQGQPKTNTEIDQIEAGGDVTETLQWETQIRDAGTEGIEVLAGEASNTTDVTINDPTGPDETFEIDSLDVPDEAQVGEEVTAMARIENTGDDPAEQVIRLDAGGDTVELQRVSIGPDDAVDVPLTWEPTSDDRGTVDLTVRTDDDDATESVAVVENDGSDADFQVSNTSANDPVSAGDTLTVTATIENGGSEADTQYVRLEAGGSEVAFEQVSLGPDDGLQEVSFTWETAPGDDSIESVTMVTDDDSESIDVDIQPAEQAAGTFEVLDGEQTDSPTTAGEQLTVTAEIENTGSTTAMQYVRLEADGSEVAFEQVSLAPEDDPVTVPLTWETVPGDDSVESVTVLTDDDSESVDVDIQPADETAGVLTVEGFAHTNAPTTAGGEVEMTATVNNTGDSRVTQYVQLEADGSGVDFAEVTLAPDDPPVTVPLTWTTDASDAGMVDMTARTDDDSETTEVEVEPDEGTDSQFEVTDVAPADPIDAGETLDVTVELNNTGSDTDEQYIRLEAGSSEVDFEKTELSAGEEDTVTLSWDTDDTDDEIDEITIRTDDDSKTVSVEIEAVDGPDTQYDVDITDIPDDVEAGNPVDVTAEITNTDPESEDQWVRLTDSGGNLIDLSDSQINLNSGMSTEVDLTMPTQLGDVGTETLTVETDDDSASDTVDITEQPSVTPSINISIESVTDDPVAGDVVAVDVKLTGGTKDVVVELRDFDDTLADFNTSVDSDGGTATLTWDTTRGDAGDGNIEVRVGTGSRETASLTLEAPPESVAGGSGPGEESNPVGIDIDEVDISA